MEVEEFEAFFRSMRPKLLRYAMRSLDADTANDIALEALHVVWTKKIPTPADEMGWRRLRSLTFSVADGLVRNANRAQWRRSRLTGALLRQGEAVAAVERDVAEVVAEQASLDELYPVLRELSVTDREVIDLVVDGYRVAEIAEILGCSPGAVSMRLRRARANLKRLLGR